MNYLLAIKLFKVLASRDAISENICCHCGSCYRTPMNRLFIQFHSFWSGSRCREWTSPTHVITQRITTSGQLTTQCVWQVYTKSIYFHCKCIDWKKWFLFRYPRRRVHIVHLHLWSRWTTFKILVKKIINSDMKYFFNDTLSEKEFFITDKPIYTYVCLPPIYLFYNFECEIKFKTPRYLFETR